MSRSRTVRLGAAEQERDFEWKLIILSMQIKRKDTFYAAPGAVDGYGWRLATRNDTRN